jgi:thioredoxin-like negative regulator of GroEL
MPRIEQLRGLLAAEPDDVFLHFALAMELTKVGQSDEALSHFSRVMELDPDYTAAYVQKARILIEMKHPDAARQTIIAGLEAARRKSESHTAEKLEEMLQALGDR